NVSEADMYPLFSNLVMLVAHHAKQAVEAHSAGGSSKPKVTHKEGSMPVTPGLVLPLNDDKSGIGNRYRYYSRDNEEIDENGVNIIGALTLRRLSSSIGPQGRQKYSNIFSVVKMRRWSTGSSNSYVAIAKHTQRVYAAQIERRYAWGLTLCGTEARIILFHHDGVRVSPVIDISELDGIKMLVTILVHWSFCSPERLGYDPSIAWNEETSNWEILCANSEGSYNPTPYVITRTLYGASTLFGRHTRCFLVRRKDGGNNNRETVLKSSWSLPFDRTNVTDSYAVVSNEMDILRHIARVLGSRNQNYIFPQVVLGGEVRLLKGDEYVTDDTTQIYEYDGWEEQQAFRVYRHLNMSPVGHPLNSAENEEELVLVLADVMEFHNAIFEQCNVLHRDISVNNILVVRDFEGQSASQPVRGLLIDYDHAVRTDQRYRSYSRRSGSLPFMSIHNLEAHESERTALDDWESLLYVICWLATFGINQADRETIGRAGGSNLPTDQPSAEQPDRDPLVLRKENENAIIGTLLEAIQIASAEAQTRLARRAANEGNTAAPAQ
ncbi:hypothetical protein EV175_005302, partial [Coemansia sp. RSA 1933]